ncbi:MAG: 1-(5-phosphoribosyl)-5-[(5-phosphoribosylamino)methylideneamino]imidazole-4-carboxamide isomerase [Clostridia bacterium]|nr:1-(5-phosphoribosyl)-5-[(5-phosphoribosylamino)methylideneamino]imidazole-4-carboxamide isomerase [Clostridia bacterium]
MIIFPAIDLYDKKAVRLFKGDYNNMTVYSENPIEVAYDFEKKGATAVHIVDLEGAKLGTTPNIQIVEQIVKNTGLFTEIGGGIRSMETVKKYIDIGVDRVILGTAAVENRDFLVNAVKTYGEKIAVGADVKDGFIAIKGWTQKSELTLDDFLRDMESIGVKTVICTDISKDGAMKGTNHELYSELSKKFSLNITASGGVSTINDVKKLAEMNMSAAIIGKAYYTGDIDLSKAIEVAK